MFTNIFVILETPNNFDDITLQQAIMIADATQSRLILACVFHKEESRFSDPFAWRLQRMEVKNALDNLQKQLLFRGIESTNYILDTSDINQLNDVIRDNDVDLIIKSKTQESIDDLLNNLLKTITVPMITVSQTISPIKRILVPLDGSARAECSLAVMTLLAQHWNCEVILFHAVQPPHGLFQKNPSEDERDILQTLISSATEKAEKYLQDVAKSLLFDTSIKIVVSDQVYSTIHQMIEDEEIDLIVLSAHGESGQPQWPYGSITHNIIAYAQIPVLVIQDLPTTTGDSVTNMPKESLRQPSKQAATN